MDKPNAARSRESLDLIDSMEIASEEVPCEEGLGEEASSTLLI